MNYCYRFPVVKGMQAGKTYYIGMVPLKSLKRIFVEEEEYVMPEYRAQRRINESRIPEIKKYILENRESYIFSAIAASIDGDFRFLESNQDGLGILEVDLDARFLINDGQHRKAAILSALEEDESLGNETISVVFYEDLGLKNSQQMFTDLNKHAVKTSNSIAELYDSRDPLAVTTRNVISKIEFLNKYVDKEKDILGKYSSALFTLNTFYNANKKILGRTECNKDFESFVYIFWKSVCANMIPWIELEEGEIPKKELREKYIATQAVVIQALGRVGSQLYKEEKEAEKNLKGLRKIDWRRGANCWKLRAIRGDGRLQTGENAQILISNIIKQSLDLILSNEEKRAEEEYLKSVIIKR